jgi:UDP-3-O-[3-hydroxymyristoyl] N-acetylglucosamine deacetylase / 3-hydroxyacyl-[acyl-carrier-protein] dehydratase
MSAPNQRTLAGSTELEGAGLHTAQPARLRFLPAEAGTGIIFRRTDLDGAPEVAVSLDNIRGTELGTTLGSGETEVRTVEHLLAAIGALELDNAVIEITGPEVPIMDGSFQPFLEAIGSAGLREQDAPARVWQVSSPVSLTGPNGGHYICAPGEALRISATIEFDHPLVRRQFATFPIDGSFPAELGPARTFGFMRDKERLQARGLALGATYENTVVLDEEAVASGPLRFPDEFVRHKIGDLLGDLTVLGGRVRGSIVAERPSHAGNLELARAIRSAARRGGDGVVDITKILQYLPHRFPMLLVDRIIDFELGKRIVGIKNVTINEPFFQGHYPGHPIMPGVLIIEAMAQTAGAICIHSTGEDKPSLVYFMTVDGAKFRRPVEPGDRLEIHVKKLKQRGNIWRFACEAQVDGAKVAEAEISAMMSPKQ